MCCDDGQLSAPRWCLHLLPCGVATAASCLLISRAPSPACLLFVCCVSFGCAAPPPAAIIPGGTCMHAHTCTRSLLWSLLACARHAVCGSAHVLQCLALNDLHAFCGLHALFLRPPQTCLGPVLDMHAGSSARVRARSATGQRHRAGRQVGGWCHPDPLLIFCPSRQARPGQQRMCPMDSPACRGCFVTMALRHAFCCRPLHGKPSWHACLSCMHGAAWAAKSLH